jgi:putative lumazine-binding protein
MSHSRLLSLVVPVCLCTTLGAQNPPPEEREVLATVQRLFDAMRTRDTATMRSLFVRDARLFGMRTRQTGEVVLQSLTADQFAAFVARDTRAPWIERPWNPEIRVRGSLATVWAEYDFHFGTQFSHCGVDAVQLLKVPERGWQIVSIADTFEREGCPRRPPPNP